VCHVNSMKFYSYKGRSKSDWCDCERI